MTPVASAIMPGWTDAAALGRTLDWLPRLEALEFDPPPYAERGRGPADRVPGSPWPRHLERG